MYDSLPQISGPEWRMDLYRAGDHVSETMFDLVSPVELPEFRGELGLYHYFEIAADEILEHLRRQYFSADFVSPLFLLSRKFYYGLKKYIFVDFYKIIILGLEK